jgi:transposase, IS30 family
MGTQYRQLSFEEKAQIHILHASHLSLRHIALKLGRAPSTIQREIARVVAQGIAYSPQASAERHKLLRARCGLARRKLGNDINSELWQCVIQQLTEGYSPEQYAGRIRALYFAPHLYLPCPYYVSHETIYRAIYNFHDRPTRNWLVHLLRQSRAGRRKWGRASRRSTGLQHIVPISERDLQACLRELPGHWEGDLIKGCQGTTAVVLSLVERASRYTLLVKLPNGTASTVHRAIVDAMLAMPRLLRKSLAYDRGSEMALHQRIAEDLNIPVYICDPYSPWQRGTNENTNGLVRQYLRKGTDLTHLTQSQLDVIEDRLNNRARKCLKFFTPSESLAKLWHQTTASS